MRTIFVIIVSLLISYHLATKIRITSQITLHQERNNLFTESTNNMTTVPSSSEPNAATIESFRELSLLIPITFWTDQNGNSSQTYIALQTMYNKYLSCSPDHVLSANSTQLSQNSLWRPIKIRQTLIALKSSNGKYLGFKDQKFRCDFDRLSPDNYFDTLKNPLSERTVTVPGHTGESRTPSSFNTTAGAMEAGGTAGMRGGMTNEDTLAFKINQGYLGTEVDKVIFSKELNMNSVFKAPEKQITRQ